MGLYDPYWFIMVFIACGVIARVSITALSVMDKNQCRQFAKKKNFKSVFVGPHYSYSG
jgi:hypothetical protein